MSETFRAITIYCHLIAMYLQSFPIPDTMPFHLAVQCSMEPPDESRQGPPYVCPRCSRQYNWRQSFHRHVNTECTQDKRFQCTMCPYSNNRKDSFLLHLRRKHRDLTRQ